MWKSLCLFNLASNLAVDKVAGMSFFRRVASFFLRDEVPLIFKYKGDV